MKNKKLSITLPSNTLSTSVLKDSNLNGVRNPKEPRRKAMTGGTLPLNKWDKTTFYSSIISKQLPFAYPNSLNLYDVHREHPVESRWDWPSRRLLCTNKWEDEMREYLEKRWCIQKSPISTQTNNQIDAVWDVIKPCANTMINHSFS